MSKYLTQTWRSCRELRVLGNLEVPRQQLYEELLYRDLHDRLHPRLKKIRIEIFESNEELINRIGKLHTKIKIKRQTEKMQREGEADRERKTDRD